MAHKDYSQSGVGATIELGKGGAKIKNSSGVVENRNNADDDYAVVRGATPVADNDLATKAWVEKRYGVAVTGQIDGGSPPAASVLGRIFICTTAGGVYTLNYLYRDTGAAWVEIVPAEGQVVGVTDALTGGTVEFSADHSYIWDLDNTEWDDIGPSAGTDSGKYDTRIVTLDYTDVGANNIDSVVPLGATVVSVRTNVTQTFDGTGQSLIIGDAVDDDRLMTAAEINLAEAVLFDVETEYTYGAATQLVATLASTSPTQGQCKIMVTFIHA